jgi:hypothetical protein
VDGLSRLNAFKNFTLPSQFPRYIAPNFLQYLSEDPIQTTENKRKEVSL